MDQTALGKYFHDYRTERHISMQDAAIGLTKSTISRFERGLTDLSTATASQLMYNIGMDAYSLAEALQDTNHELPDLADAVVSGDFNAIKQAVNEYAFHHNTRNARILVALAKATENKTDVVHAYLEQQVANALAYPQTWGKVEFAIIALAFPRTSVELIEMVLTRMFKQIDHNLSLIIKPLAFACVLAISRTGTALRGLIKPVTNILVSTQKYALSMNEYAPYIRTVDEIIHDDDAQAVISATHTCGATAIADFLTHQIGIAESVSLLHHNGALIDTFDPSLELDDSKPLLSGVNLANVRNQRGLTIDDVTSSWSISAQSRFEHGKTELGFSRCLQLLSLLEIDIETLVHTADLPNSYSRAKSEILVVCDSTPVVVSQFHKILTNYRLTNADRPAGLVTIELAALRKTAVLYTNDHHPDLDTGIDLSLSDDQQHAIANYICRLDELSVRDFEMIKQVIGEMDAKRTDSIITAITKHIPKNPHLADAMLENALFVVDGPIYYQNWQLVKKAIDFLGRITPSPSTWQHHMHRSHIELLHAAHRYPTADIKQRSNDYLAALQIVYPHPTNGYAIENWVHFAMDGDYHHFES